MLWRRIGAGQWNGGGLFRFPFVKARFVTPKQSHEPRFKIMDDFSAYLELMKSKEGQVEMSDVLLARSLVRDIGGKEHPVGVMLFEAFDKLRKMFPHGEEPHKQWTERRLKAWWNRETENVLHREMVELYEAAAKAKEERALLSAARREHAEFIAKTARIAALLERQDEDFHRGQIEAMGQQLGRMGGPGNSGD